jgi:DNA-directed RNA polymerase subunit RPC12/RpoP
MALIQCSECGKDVSTQAKTCPSCGAKVQLPIPPKPPKRPTSPVIKFSLIAAVLGTFSLLWLNGKDNREARGAEEKRVASLTPAERAADTLLKEKAAAKTYSAAQTAKTEKEAADKLARAARDKDKVQEDFAFKHAAQMMPKLVAGLLDPESAKINGVYIDSTGDLLCVLKTRMVHTPGSRLLRCHGDLGE